MILKCSVKDHFSRHSHKSFPLILQCIKYTNVRISFYNVGFGIYEEKGRELEGVLFNIVLVGLVASLPRGA